MTAHLCQSLRPGLRVAAALVAITLPITALPVPALAADVTPASAASARKPVQDRAKQLMTSDAGEAAEYLSKEARQSGDPVLFLDAAEAYKTDGVATRDKAALQAAVEHASIGLDIANFQTDARCDPGWQHLDVADFDRELARGKKLIADSEKAIDELDKPAEAPPPAEEPKERRRAPRDGRGLIAGGSLLTLVGVGGLGMIGAGLAIGSKAQKDVEALNPSDIDYDSQVVELDKKGKSANMITYIGIPVAAVGLAAGIALIAVGVKKRKAYRAEHGASETALHVVPALGRGFAGLSVGGRF